MLSEIWRTAAQVDCDIEHRTLADPYKLSLWLRNLIMDCANDILPGERAVVLSPGVGKAGLSGSALIPSFPKRTSIIAENSWF
jgi:hypothetical protein